MFTLEQKVNLVMRYVTTVDQSKKLELRRMLLAALKEDEENEPRTYAEAVELISRDILKEIGMPPHLLGYDYALTAIQLCAIDPSYLDGYVTKRLYPDVAKRFNSTPTRTERNIRHAIESVFHRGNGDIVANIFGNVLNVQNGKLSNSEFFAVCANKISSELKARGIYKEDNNEKEKV